jgi:hypothetical protein
MDFANEWFHIMNHDVIVYIFTPLDLRVFVNMSEIHENGGAGHQILQDLLDFWIDKCVLTKCLF